MPRLPVVTHPTPEQKPVHDYLLKTRGPAGVRGGFGVMLASPELAQRIAHLGSYIRFDSKIPERMRSVAALAISAELENPWEYTVHARLCRERGVPEAVVQALLECQPVNGAEPDDRLAIDIARAMARHHQLDQATFDAARQRLGDAGVVDLLATIGYYAMFAVTHKALEVFPEER